ncbi:outer membrane lipoprotein chaperone LolA [Paraglaciecola sp. MB-3u-78]|jgi:outer membrane lipoprotein carrier protein|uniref:outer membrane lipoprotein chaperone LolA n=1 Tax=Paraglaciecola sp. MB-3u-78 TaxID=2058332 RepID=UPI000C3350D4|nr:outer membrane lipoprotein chaperone LolA [Paraglaciecola sp. MB-3u-78]PKG97419.1 outer membrane lipoprotein carrier protein LolA [Paraglaciecola sp. MB-3u-78]
MNKLSQLKQLILFTTVLLNSTFVLATDMDAKQHLKVKLDKLATYQANFTQTVVDIENTLLQQATGRIVLQQPNKLYWELFEPNESVLLADGDNIWNIDPFLEQVVVNRADIALVNNPLILLTNPDSSQWQEFEVSQADNQFIITPRELTGGIVSLRLVFKGDTLVELESQDGQQQKSVLLFSEIKQNHSLPADTFLFVMPDGYELDDQR